MFRPEDQQPYPGPPATAPVAPRHDPGDGRRQEPYVILLTRSRGAGHPVHHLSRDLACRVMEMNNVLQATAQLQRRRPAAVWCEAEDFATEASLLLAACRERGALPPVPVIMACREMPTLTAQRAWQEQGASDILSRPFELQLIARRLAMYLTWHRICSLGAREVSAATGQLAALVQQAAVVQRTLHGRLLELSSELHSLAHAPRDNWRDRLAELADSADYAAALTEQLDMVHGRSCSTAAADVGRVVTMVSAFAGKALGEAGELRLHLPQDPLYAALSADALEDLLQLLLRLAGEALRPGAQLHLRVQAAFLDNEPAAEHSLEVSGPCVLITLSDSGYGPGTLRAAPAEALRGSEQEPLLVTACELAMRHGGSLQMLSRPPRGICFSLWLPAAAEPAPDPPTLYPSPAEASIMVVEEERGVRDLISEMLATQGFQVTPVAHPQVALELADGAPAHLLIADWSLPAPGAVAMAHRLAAQWRHLRVLFISGLTQHVRLPSGPWLVADALQKPFTMTELLARIRALLGTNRGPAAGGSS